MTQASDVAVTFAINTRIRPSTDIVNLCDSKVRSAFVRAYIYFSSDILDAPIGHADGLHLPQKREK